MTASLRSGSRLGSYEILSPLGAGGMGEVFRAHDTKLNRDVAIKVLPPAFVEDKERVARFRREAQLVASLNHPNVAAIYGLEESNGSVALALELVEGEDLAQRLARGPLPVDEAIAIATQIAQGLEAAHERGIVHRDLKPANVKLTRDGTVKILDFGLAKAMASDASSGDSALSQSPTMSRHMTEAGMILGTAAYMSPEQARGKPVDERSDIWSFGVVLFEMLTSERLFAGETVSDTLAGILKGEIDFTALPAETPSNVRRLLRRCLQRDPRNRLRDIGDARLELSPDAEPAGPGAPPAAVRVSRGARLAVGALALTALASAALAVWLFAHRQTAAPLTRLSIALPEGQSVLDVPAISRDGRRVAFVSGNGVESPALSVRLLDGEASRTLPGTEDAEQPFFSPDGEWVAFYARNQLFKVRVDGGAPVALAGSTSHYGGTWTDDGNVVFKKSWNDGLQIVSANGGEARPLTTLAAGEYAHVWPYALPGGREVLFDVWGKTFEVVRFDLGTRARRTVASRWWRRLAWTPPGFLFSVLRTGELSAARLAPSARAIGTEAAVQKGIDGDDLSGGSRFDVSWNGTLVFVRGFAGGQRLVRVSRRGEVTRLPVAESGAIEQAAVSPDGTRTVVVVGGRLDVVDLARGTVTPLLPELSGGSGAESAPVWSADGRSVVFAGNHEGSWDVYSKNASGAGEIRPVLRRPGDEHATSCAPDGTLLLEMTGERSGADLWILPPGGPPRAWLATPAQEREARFSPDGRTVAYSSNGSGRFEVYVQDRDDPLQRVQVSVSGGYGPAWSPKGDRLYFRHENLVMEAAIRTAGGLSAATPARLFDGGWTLTRSGALEPMPDGEGFLMVERPPEAVPKRIEVVLGWSEELERKVAAR